jgi:hypothetical protein
LTKAQRDTLRRRVQRGAAYLDEHVAGWELMITDDLNLGDTSHCVLGQVFTDYYRGLAKIDERFTADTYWAGDPYSTAAGDRFAAQHAFDLAGPPYDYSDLTIAWENLLADRRKDPAAYEWTS